jgi:hypothetical protein
VVRLPAFPVLTGESDILEFSMPEILPRVLSTVGHTKTRAMANKNGGARGIPDPTAFELDLGAQCGDVNSSGNDDGVDDVNDTV